MVLRTGHESYNCHIDHLSSPGPIPRILGVLFGKVDDLDIYQPVSQKTSHEAVFSNLFRSIVLVICIPILKQRRTLARSLCHLIAMREVEFVSCVLCKRCTERYQIYCGDRPCRSSCSYKTKSYYQRKFMINREVLYQYVHILNCCQSQCAPLEDYQAVDS